MWNRKNKNDLYFEILEKCANKGLFDTVDCMPEIKRYLIKANVKGASNWYDTVNMLLEPLREQGYIHFIRFGQSEEDMATIPENWIDKLAAPVLIKPAGLLFLYEKRKIDQQSKTNNLTVWFIGVTLFVGVGNLYFARQSVQLTKAGVTYKADTVFLNSQLHLQSIRINKLKQDSIRTHLKLDNILKFHIDTHHK